ncbi:MAG: TatD family hydrolase [Spirochaetaceae bacterium]|jgi:TatD DNase family protein|nr:TatD family hydrolase [Spirochaetaceae bacterium]
MASDAHAHPYDLSRLLPEAEALRRERGIACAASAWGQADFAYNMEAAKTAPASAPLPLCFGVHPQLPLQSKDSVNNSIHILETLIYEKRIAAIGECGFDLFNAAYRETCSIQNELFFLHIELAQKSGLPLVLHVRRAMHKIFENIKALKKISAVIFHSYSGTLGEAEALTRRGVNAYFSLGNALLSGRRETRRVCAACDERRLLFETDAPYQPPRNSLDNRTYSFYTDIYAILNEAAALRGITPPYLEEITDINFKEAYCYV